MRLGLTLLVLLLGLSPFARATPQDGPAASGPGAIGPPPVPSDLELVEKLIEARKNYQQTLEKLWQHYNLVGDSERAAYAKEELLGYHRINRQVFRLDLEIPNKGLQAKFNYPDANKLYAEAKYFKDQGGFDNYRRAELKFKELLARYPLCSRIGDAAYQLAEIYESRYFNQPRVAALYYERSHQWNPTAPSDALIRAARIYDRILSERSEALRLYRQVQSQEADPARIQEAERRIAELTRGPR